MSAKKGTLFYDTPMEDEKAYVAAGGVVLSVSSNSIRVPVQEEGVELLATVPNTNR